MSGSSRRGSGDSRDSLPGGTQTIRVDYLARVEGEGGIYVKIRDAQVKDVQLKIFEPPRFFEALLRGRMYTEAPDITARICGICPVAYQMSAAHAMERALGVAVGGQLRALRRLLYCGEWIESHALHIYMLHAPDFLGYPDALSLARDYPDVVKQGLALKKAGNAIVKLLGGREVHPINVRVGGFYRTPTRRELAPLAEELKVARELALETVRWVSRLPFPDFAGNYHFVALRHPDEYPFNEGRIVSSQGLDIDAQDFEQHIIEEQVPYSNALHATLHGEPYFVGPLARYNLNYTLLSPLAREAAQEAGLEPTCSNPYQSIVVRAVETLFACDEALRLIEAYDQPDAPAVEAVPAAGVGWACTEAPRGILYHRYRLDMSGVILDAKIVPPTSQNQKIIESDLRRFVAQVIDEPPDRIQAHCEHAVRNYDPCISCATHFLPLVLDRE